MCYRWYISKCCRRYIYSAIISDRDTWKNKKEHLTPNYLTDIDQIMTVRI